MRNTSHSVLGLLLIGGFACGVLLAQRTPTDEKSPQLRLRIEPNKPEYAPNEKVVLDLTLENLTNDTLCFPQPDKKCRNTRSGSLIVEAGRVRTGNEREAFICEYCEGSWGPHEKLVSAIREKWVKLAPRSTYLSRSVEAQVILDMPGEWRLKASYRPPVAAFGDPVEYRKYLDSGAAKAGCIVPGHTVSAEPLAIKIVTNPVE